MHRTDKKQKSPKRREWGFLALDRQATLQDCLSHDDADGKRRQQCDQWLLLRKRDQIVLRCRKLRTSGILDVFRRVARVIHRVVHAHVVFSLFGHVNARMRNTANRDQLFRQYIADILPQNGS